MKNIKLLLLVLLSLFLFGIFLFWNNYRLDIQKRSRIPVSLPDIGSSECGVEDCHGLDITCGSNIAEVCDMMYVAGDRCRELALCEIVEGECVQKYSPEFEACKACVEKCQNDYPDSGSAFFDCESECY